MSRNGNLWGTHYFNKIDININPLNENCRLSTETEIFAVFARQRRVRDTRYNWRLCEDSERRDASLISQSLPLCFCEISPSQAQAGQLCLCQTIPLLTLLHFRKPQIKCERGATGGMIPRVCGETDVWCANTELEHQPLLSPLWLVEAAKSHDGWIFQHVPNLCSLGGKKWAPALCRMTNHHA